MNADAKELTISALKALALAAVLLVAFIYLFKWLGMGEQTETQTPAASASTTTEPSPTTTTRPPRQPDPSIGRPAFTEFSILMWYDDTLRSTCAESYQDDIPACYDAFERGTDDFESKIRDALEAHIQASVGGTRGYNSNQYGCHDDGRCLDDADEWCRESEISYVDGFGLACPGTLEWISEQTAEDLYQRQMEQERYP